MKLDYPQKSNGLFVLSKAQIDEIAMKVLTKYAPLAAQQPGTLDIERLAQDDFCLTVLDKYMRRDYLGLTAFDDLTIRCHDLERQAEILEISEGTMILNATLLHEQNARRRRFTLAHELSHLSTENHDDSGGSIENQKRIIEAYVREHPELQLATFYVDDGFSGVIFDRPGLMEMLRDIAQKKIHCVIVKDSSRLGRDLIEVGHLVERVFPAFGVRLIAILNGYDSTDDKFTPSFTFQNLVKGRHR